MFVAYQGPELRRLPHGALQSGHRKQVKHKKHNTNTTKETQHTRNLTYNKTHPSAKHFVNHVRTYPVSAVSLAQYLLGVYSPLCCPSSPVCTPSGTDCTMAPFVALGKEQQSTTKKNRTVKKHTHNKHIKQHEQ